MIDNDKNIKENLKRINTYMRFPATVNENKAISIAIEFLLACNKKNPSASNVRIEEAGLYTIDVGYDSTGNDEEDKTYKYTIESLKHTL